MATTFVNLLPYGAEFPASNFPQLTLINRRPALAFDASVDEACQWTFLAPQSITTTITLVVSYIMASAASGTIDFEADLEAVTDGDATDLDAGDSFATANTMTAETVPGVSGYMGQFTITLTNNDGIAAGDYVRLRLRRDADDASNDTATGDCYVLAAELRYA